MDLRAERGLSQFDTRNRFVTSFLYELPIGRAKPVGAALKLLNGFISGWQAVS